MKLQTFVNDIRLQNGLLILLPILVFSMHFKVFNLEPVGFHAWRQCQTLATAKSFAQEDLNILNPRIDARKSGDGIQRIEFPLFQWLLALLFILFGNDPLVFRGFCFVIFMYLILNFYKLLKHLFNKRTAVFTVWCFSFSPLLYYYSLNPIPDLLGLALSIGGVYGFFKNKHLLSAFLIAAAVSIKPSFGIWLIIPVMSLFLLKQYKLIIPYFAFLLPVIYWFWWVIPTWGGDGIAGIHGETEGFKDSMVIIWKTLISTLPELLVNYLSVPAFILGAFLIIKHKTIITKNKTPWVCALSAFLLFYLIDLKVINTIHDYYFLPVLPLIFMSISWYIFSQTNESVAKSIVILLLILTPVSSFLRINHRWDKEKPGFNADYLNYGKQIDQLIPDGDLTEIYYDKSGCIGHYYTHTKGWSFAEKREYRLGENPSSWVIFDLLNYEKNGLMYTKESDVHQFGTLVVRKTK